VVAQSSNTGAEPALAPSPNVAAEQPVSRITTGGANPPVIEPRAESDIAIAARSQRVDFDLAVLAAANLVTPDAPRSQVADEFRVVKRPLINNVKSANGSSPARNNLIMVTSAVAGEGKSFTAINLAMSIAAELDHTVMLVDADLARPSLPTMLGVEDGPGLLDLLDGSAEMSDVLLRTNIEKLTFLRGGTPHGRLAHLRGFLFNHVVVLRQSSKMRRVLSSSLRGCPRFHCERNQRRVAGSPKFGDSADHRTIA